ncbi:MAG: nucleotidyl transferase AbiEii/AbiGii toxin family protein [Bacteroidota bacterium]
MEHLMNFHQAPEFRDALQSASSAMHMRFILVEKDYWVTKVLQNLAFSDFRDLVVFKGGTSLSKAYNCIDRFSEDVDLAILKGEGMRRLLSDESFKMVDLVIQDDKSNAFFTGEWMSHPLSECPIFKDIDHFWGALKSTYEFELPQISWAPAIPSAEQIQMALHGFRTFLLRYDNFSK